MVSFSPEAFLFRFAVLAELAVLPGTQKLSLRSSQGSRRIVSPKGQNWFDPETKSSHPQLQEPLRGMKPLEQMMELVT